MKESVSFWGCLVIANVYSASHDLWRGAIWIAFALVIWIVEVARPSTTTQREEKA